MNKTHIKPNLFIVGTRKTGSTSLYHYLKEHPDVFMSPVKEPHYFSQQHKYHIHLYTQEKEYLSLFKKVSEEKIFGEASTSYLDDPSIAKSIAHFNPNAKIIIIIQDPVELIYRMHFEFAFRGRAEECFETELEKQKQNKTILNYKNIASALPASIEAYIKEFGQENVHIIDHKDFEKNTEAELTRVLKFLDLDTSHTPNFKRYNLSTKPRSRLIATLLNTQLVTKIGKFIYHYLPQGNTVDPFLLNKTPFKRPLLKKELRQELEKEFQAITSQLKTILIDNKTL